MKTNTKILAASVSLFTSVQAFAGLGGLNVQSNLGEPFAGSIVVTGSEAQALIKSGKVNVSGSGVHGTVISQPNGTAVIRLRSSSAVTEPVLTFTVQAGNQTRQYSAMVNPSRYVPAQAQARTQPVQNVQAAPVQPRTQPAPVAAETQAPARAVAAETRRQPPRAAQRRQAAQERQERQAAAKPRTRNPSHAIPQPMPQRDSNSQYHQVQAGEHLAAIAERYRPHNMTLQQAMRALVRANPRAFRNGNPNSLYSNSTLYIPTDAQWHAYANGKGSRRNAVPRPAQAVIPPVAPPATTETPQTAPEAKPTPPVTPPTVEPAAPPAPASPAVAPPPVTPVTPVEPTPPAASPAAVPPAVGASDALPDAGGAASAVPLPPAGVSASDAVVPPPVVEPAPQPPAPQPAPTPADETDWMQYGLMGLGGLAALGGAAYLLGRRKRKEGAPDDGGGDEFDVRPVAAAPTAAEAAQRVKWGSQSDAAEPELNDQDDDVFFAESLDEQPAAATPAQPVAKSFDLDDFEPEAVEPARVRTAAEQFDASDWQDAALGLGGAAAATGLAAAAAHSQASAPAAGFAEDDFVVADADGEQWLQEMAELERREAEEAEAAVEADLSFDSFDNFAPAADSVQAAAEETEVLQDFDFNTAKSFNLADGFGSADNLAAADDFGADDFAAGSAVAAETVAQTASLDDFVSEFSAEPAQVQVAETAFAEAEPTMDFALDDDFGSLNAAAAEPAAAIAEPATEVDLSFALDDTANTGLVQDATALDFAAADDFGLSETPVAAQPENVFAQAEDTLAFELDEPQQVQAFAEPAAATVSTPVEEAFGLNNLNADFGTEELPQPQSSFVQDFAPTPFEEPETVVPQSDVGFVTGAVGMEAPLEAKLELAKMYLEIDDAVAARETLRELIGESGGEVQAKAKALLDELGG